MVYESSYDSGRKPFRPDVTRGYWAAPGDFICAGLGLGLRLDLLTVSWVFAEEMGIFAIIPYVICLAVYVVPLVVIQTFMGQFSSTGFISSFRLSPIFKGMGYIAIAINLATLMYYSVLATVPLLFLINSFRPTIPWSCEGFATWGQNLTEKSLIQFFQRNFRGENATENPINTICDLPEVSYNFKLDKSSNEGNFNFGIHYVPSVLFAGSLFGDPFMFTEILRPKFSLSWEIILCTLLSWAIIAGIFCKFFNTKKIGKLIRYGVWITVGLLVIFLIRVSFLQGSQNALLNYLYPDLKNISYGMMNTPIFVLSAFGAGWGSMITLASFNKFKVNIMSQSWYICLGHMLIFIAFDLLTSLIGNHLSEVLPIYADKEPRYALISPHWELLLNSGSVLARMKWPNMWCILFFLMLTVIALVFIIIHLYSTLTSIFDEFETLRDHKMAVSLAVIGFLALCSLYISSSHGLFYFSTLPVDVIFTQTALNLLLLLVVLWIYGRKRFQRDIEFMLGHRFSTWRVYMLRFISPLCLLLTLIFSIVMAYLEHFTATTILTIIAIIFIFLPWLFVPIYAVIIMLQTSGSLKMRFKRCCQPSDWYPVEAEDRQRYEDAMGNLDITHQLNEIIEDVTVT